MSAMRAANRELESIMASQLFSESCVPPVRAQVIAQRELGQFINPKEAFGSSLRNYPRCMFQIGKLEPRGDLFEHLKKPKPLPEARPGVPMELRTQKKNECIRNHPPADVHASTPGTRRLLFESIQSWRDTLKISIAFAFL